MYHSVIGKRMVACVNQREGTNYSVREFFDTVYIPLFFSSSRLLQIVNNSPFDQTFTKQKLPFTVALRDDCLQRVHKKVDHQEADASFFLGGPAAGCAETTSGQVTSIKLPIDKEDIYASWIGAASGLTVEGGMTLLIDAEDVLLTTFDGWKEYRRFVDQTPTVKALQINTWNGQWLTSKMSGSDYFHPHTIKDASALETQKWTGLLFALCFHYRERSTNNLLAYVYSLGQSNTTLGFVTLNLFAARRIVDVYQQMFKVPDGMPPKSFESLYETARSFRAACSQTQIGLRALKPKDVFNAQKGIPKAPRLTDLEKRIAFDTYQTWIIAMINNKELLSRSEELATALYAFQKLDERAKTINVNMVSELLEKKTRRDFIDGLTVILDREASNRELFELIVQEILIMSPENFPLFLTLIRFKFSAIKAKV